MLSNRAADTAPEAALRSTLHRRGFRFRKHARVLPALRCRPDVVFPTEKVAVFIDGCFWHGCPDHARQPKRNSDYWRAKIERNKARDLRNDAALTDAGWKVIRAWEHEPVDHIADLVVEFVANRRSTAAQRSEPKR
jgi:DNA mismatch endonuclease, patch repair protein